MNEDMIMVWGIWASSAFFAGLGVAAGLRLFPLKPHLPPCLTYPSEGSTNGSEKH